MHISLMLKKIKALHLWPLISQDSELLPVLTIRLELTGSEVLFNPSLDENSASSSVQESAEGWLNDFLERGNGVRPVDEDVKVI